MVTAPLLFGLGGLGKFEPVHQPAKACCLLACRAQLALFVQEIYTPKIKVPYFNYL